MEWAAGCLPTDQQTESEEEAQGGANNFPGSVPDWK